MMRLARRASLLVAFSLLTSAATAYAECAWVLWEEWSSVPTALQPVFSVVTGTSTEASCRDKLRKEIGQFEALRLRPGEERRVDGDSILTRIPDARGEIAHGMRKFICLPDTVDPRGPKGK